MQDLAAEVKKAAAEGKCIDTAMKEIKLPKYENWGNYANSLPMNVERYCLPEQRTLRRVRRRPTFRGIAPAAPACSANRHVH